MGSFTCNATPIDRQDAEERLDHQPMPSLTAELGTSADSRGNLYKFLVTTETCCKPTTNYRTTSVAPSAARSSCAHKRSSGSSNCRHRCGHCDMKQLPHNNNYSSTKLSIQLQRSQTISHPPQKTRRILSMKMIPTWRHFRIRRMRRTRTMRKRPNQSTDQHTTSLSLYRMVQPPHPQMTAPR